MAGFVRLAGHGAWPSIEGLGGFGGRTVVTWTIAEGRRGRRWRSLTQPSTVGVLAETGLDGGLERVEVSSPAGLMTLHPSEDLDTLHGNLVTPAGVRHLRFAWSAEHELLIPASPLVLTAIVARLARAVAVGLTNAHPVVVVSDDLEIAEDRWAFRRVGARAWSVGPERPRASAQAIEVDNDDTPLLAGIGGVGEAGAIWLLEETG